MSEEPTEKRWIIYTMVRLQSEISELNQKLDATISRADNAIKTTIWATCFVLIVIGFNIGGWIISALGG
jgi:Ni/Fe-hydrogenase subunit HybB-like protein